MAIRVILNGDDIIADDVNQIGQWLRGDPGFGNAMALTQYSDPAIYGLSLWNLGAGGKALDIRKSDAATALLTVQNSGVLLSPDGSLAAGVPIIATGAQTISGIKTIQAPVITGYKPENLSPPPADTFSKKGFPRAWVSFQSNAVSIFDSHNVASVVRNGAGEWTITWDTDFLNANYCVHVTAEQASRAHPVVKPATRAAGSVVINCYDSAGAALDPTALHVVAYGINA